MERLLWLGIKVELWDRLWSRVTQSCCTFTAMFQRLHNVFMYTYIHTRSITYNTGSMHLVSRHILLLYCCHHPAHRQYLPDFYKLQRGFLLPCCSFAFPFASALSAH